MLLRFAVNRAKERNPQKSKHARYKKCRPPSAEALIQPICEERRNRSTDRRTAIEQRDRPSALSAREPFGNGLRSPGPIRGLAGAQQKTEGTEAANPGGKRHKHRR